MLKNHKNFRFTQIPDKTNDVIFLKSPKTLFGAIFDIFGHFCPMGFFLQNPALPQTTMYGPLKPC